MKGNKVVIVKRFCLLWILLLLAAVASPAAYADGGAPQLAYVAGSAQGISIVDIAQRRVTGTLAVGGEPRSVLLSPDGSVLYIAQPALGQVTAIEAKTRKTLCVSELPGQPTLLALSLDATTIYAAGQGDTRVYALDPTSCAIKQIFETHAPVNGLAVTASTAPNATPSTPNQLWVSGNNGLTVFEVDGKLLGTVAIAGDPQAISIPGSFTAYVTTAQGTIVAVDLNSRRVLGEALRGGRFGGLDYDATTGEIYVPDQAHNQLDVLTPISTTGMPHEPLRTLHMPGTPQSVAITSDGQFGFVALSNGQVVMLDLPGRSTVTSIKVGGAPSFIITGLYPPAVSPTANAQTTPTTTTATHNTLFPMILLALGGVCLLAFIWLFWRYYRGRPHSNQKPL